MKGSLGTQTMPANSSNLWPAVARCLYAENEISMLIRSADHPAERTIGPASKPKLDCN